MFLRNRCDEVASSDRDRGGAPLVVDVLEAHAQGAGRGTSAIDLGGKESQICIGQEDRDILLERRLQTSALKKSAVPNRTGMWLLTG